MSFSEIDYRLQTVLEHNDVEWINDSKSTSLESSCYSLEVIKKPIIWIVGTNQHKQDFSLVEKQMKQCTLEKYFLNLWNILIKK